MRGGFRSLSAAASELWPSDVCEALGVGATTLDSYVKMPGFPRPTMRHYGVNAVRTWRAAQLPEMRNWLDERRLPGPRAGHRRIANLERARTARAEVKDLLQLSDRLLRVAGPRALADALRPLGFDTCGLEVIPKNQRALTRVALVRAIEMVGAA